MSIPSIYTDDAANEVRHLNNTLVSHIPKLDKVVEKAENIEKYIYILLILAIVLVSIIIIEKIIIFVKIMKSKRGKTTRTTLRF